MGRSLVDNSSGIGRQRFGWISVVDHVFLCSGVDKIQFDMLVVLNAA